MRAGNVAAAVSALVALFVVPAGCSSMISSGPTGPEPAESVAMPGPAGAPPLKPSTSDPEELPGVDTSSLSKHEKERFWRLVTQLYTPCSDQAVSLAVCVKEARPCASCAPAVKLLGDRIRAGAMNEEAQNAYGLRFGPNVKVVDVADSPARGRPDAPVTIVEWFDFECPHCKHASKLLDRILEKRANDVRLVHKFYPLKQHARAEPAARAAIAAHNQGKYWEMQRIIFDNTQALGDQELETYAAGLKLDLKRFRADMASEKTTQMLARDHAAAEKLGLGGTPFILINGREFALGLFQLDTDLEPWVALEVELKQGTRGVAR
jgi:protein-disulfide isomerase